MLDTRESFEIRGFDLSSGSLMLALISSMSLAISSLSINSTFFTDLVQALQNQKQPPASRIARAPLGSFEPIRARETR